MPIHPTTQQPRSINSTIDLLPDEYIRFEYNYKPGCCCFTSKITTITNKRLITQTIKTPTICSKKTSSGPETIKIIDLTDIHDMKQLRSAIPSSRNTWWMKCIDILSCRYSNQQINWLESCRGVDNLAMDTHTSIRTTEDTKPSILTEKF
ncbi:hypothetical protein I4U23_030600 [Adineta vaga]|nr:hypothetical protein I4U23_030600 [Adineta vaga]